jgi:hypothetical protein
VKTLWWALVWVSLTVLIIGSAALFHAHAASVDAGVSICFALREGASLAAVESALIAQGYSQSDAGVLTGLQVRDHCPDQRVSVIKQAREALR